VGDPQTPNLPVHSSSPLFGGHHGDDPAPPGEQVEHDAQRGHGGSDTTVLPTAPVTAVADTEKSLVFALVQIL
jgi:hypothetical protein